MLSSILIAVTIACLITSVTVFVSVIMCLHFRRKRKQTKQVDDESTLASFPVTVRKLTIDHGNVITAPNSPGMVSVAKFPQPGMTIYAPSTKRESNNTAVPSPMARFTFFPKTSMDTSAPSSPRSAMSSVSPTSTRHGKTHPAMEVPLPETTWLQSISALSHPGNSAAEAEKMYLERRAALNASRSTNASNVHLAKPEAAVTSDQICIDARRKASLGAISQAVSDQSRHSSTSSSRPSPRISGDMDSSQQVRQKHSKSTLRSKNIGSPLLDVDIPTPTVSAINTPRSSIYKTESNESRRSKPDRPRKSRPPPITTSMQPPRVPDTFLTSPTDTIATVQAGIREDTLSRLQPQRLDTRASRTPRQSILSFTSSQYSPTFSIKPVEQVQIMPSARAQQVLARNTTTPQTSQTPQTPQSAQLTPPSSSTPKPIFPANYAMSHHSKHATSIESRVGPDTPDSLISAALQASGFKTSRDAPALPPLDRSVSAPSVYDVPLTSASISFPPNLPDYNFSPVEGSHTDENARAIRKGSAPQATVPRTLISPNIPGTQKRAPTTGTQRKHDGTKPTTRPGAIMAAELPAKGEATPSPISLKNVGLRGTATVSISELAGKAHMERTRRRVEIVRQRTS